LGVTAAAQSASSAPSDISPPRNRFAVDRNSCQPESTSGVALETDWRSKAWANRCGDQSLMLGRRQLLGRLGAAAALALAPSSGARAAAAEAIYQRIWDADQTASGIRAIAAGAAGDPTRGFVKVDERARADSERRLFAEVRIPESKRPTYDLCKALFDNYRFDQNKPEDNRPEKARETLALLAAVADSAPMAAARAHLEAEHSHHFWYKYYLDDWAAFSGADDIDYDGGRYDGPHRRDGRLSAIGRQVPEVVTLAYGWDAYEPETGQRRALYKPIGGFWVGCSIEGLMALGLIRFFQRGRIETTINGARYEVALHRSTDGQSLRTFFPRFLGLA
jgi:hypothetical protein